MTSPWSWMPGAPFESTEAPDASRTWSRKLWGGEMIFAQSSLFIPGRADIIMSCTIDVPSNLHLTHQHIRSATRALRFSHPSIASKVVWPPGPPNVAEAKFAYESPASEEVVTSWLDSVVFAYNKSAAEGDVETLLSTLRVDLSLANTVRTDDQLKLFHVLPCAQKPQVHGILMLLRHALFDGIGAWEVMDCWLQELSKVAGTSPDPIMLPLAWGTEVSRLARSVADRASRPWSPSDLHTDWPIVKHVNKILDRPSTSFGLPIPHLTAPFTGTDYTAVTFPESVAQGLVRNARKNGCKMFSVQLASILMSCIRVSPPDSGEHRVTLPFNPVNLRSRLSTIAPVEIVSATGFNVLEAADLHRFVTCTGDEATLEAVWTIAREIQAQMVEQDEWHDDAARIAPVLIKTLADCIFERPPPSYPLRIFGITNFGVVDSILKPEYPVPGTSSSLKIINAYFCNVIFHLPESLLPVLLHAYTWQGRLYYSFSYSPAHMGRDAGAAEEGPATLAKFLKELETVTKLLATEAASEESTAK